MSLQPTKIGNASQVMKLLTLFLTMYSLNSNDSRLTPSLLPFLYQTCQPLIKENLTNPYSIVGREARGRGGIKYLFIYYLFCGPYKTPLSFMTLQGHHLEKRTKLIASGHFFRISQLQSWPKTLLAFPIEFPVSQAYCYFFNPQ